MEKYSFVQRLGQGSFAVVWKARRKSDSRLVAVKQLKQSPDSWEACKLLPEVRAAAAISDRRYVVNMLEAVRHSGELFLVFEYLDTSLHHCASHSRRLEESQVRWAGRRLVGALAAVHSAGLVHCDVKPENILVAAEGPGGGAATLKLCDFGQAAAPENIGATYCGTRWYRAPELFLGARGDTSLDLWAVGCTLAELLLHRPLLPGSDTRDMLFRMCGELGAPDPDAWPLGAKMVEMSGRPNASAAAWAALEAAGSSKAGIDLIRGLLRYDPGRRLRADQALREEPWFAADMPEAPVPTPPLRPVSPETLRIQRDEAVALERRLKGAGAPNRGESPARLTRDGSNLDSRPISGLTPQTSTVSLKSSNQGADLSFEPNRGQPLSGHNSFERRGLAPCNSTQALPPRRTSSLRSGCEMLVPAPVATQLPSAERRGRPSESPDSAAGRSSASRATPELAEEEEEEAARVKNASPAQSNSDDEALAEAFWENCKGIGRSTPGRGTPDTGEPDRGETPDLSPGLHSNEGRRRRPRPAGPAIPPAPGEEAA